MKAMVRTSAGLPWPSRDALAALRELVRVSCVREDDRRGDRDRRGARSGCDARGAAGKSTPAIYRCLRRMGQC